MKDKSSATKDKILQTAGELFYRKGYTATYLEEIADQCGITKPLISYHYKSKSSLAREVSLRFSREVKNLVSFALYEFIFKFTEYDLQVSTATEIKITDRLYFEDPNLKRFLIERSATNFEDVLDYSSKALYEIHDRRYHLPVNHDADELSLLAAAAYSMTLGLRLSFMKGHFSCTYEEYSDYMTSLHFKLMRVPDERIAVLLTESKKILEKLDVTPLPDFKVRVAPKSGPPSPVQQP